MPPTDHPALEIALLRTEPGPVDAAVLADLSPEERERAARFRRPEDAARFVTARSVARRLLGDRLGVAPSAVALVVPRAHWKPRVAGCTLELSIAHAGDVVLVAVAEGAEIGIDVEGGPVLRRSLDEPLWRAATSPAERVAEGAPEWPAAGPPDAAATDAFLRRWTRKEAILKAVRLGLSVPMDELTLRDGTPPRVVATPQALPRPDELALLDLDAPSGTRIALAAVTRRPVVVRDAETGELLGRTTRSAAVR